MAISLNPGCAVHMCGRIENRNLCRRRREARRDGRSAAKQNGVLAA
jgi:hypothetical protein